MTARPNEAGDMAMRLRIYIALITLCGCTANAPQEVDASTKDDSVSPSVGEPYSAARKRLIESGWIPARTECTEAMVCTDYPEQVTRLANAETCGAFTKAGMKLSICTDPIPDGMLVKSVELTPVSK